MINPVWRLKPEARALKRMKKYVILTVVIFLSLLEPDPDGIADAQKSLGLGQEEKARKVR